MAATRVLKYWGLFRDYNNVQNEVKIYDTEGVNLFPGDIINYNWDNDVLELENVEDSKITLNLTGMASASFTMSLRFKLKAYPVAPTDAAYIFEQELDTASRNRVLYINADNKLAFKSKDSAQVIYDTEISLDTWYHAVIRESTKGISLYVNARLVDLAVETGNDTYGNEGVFGDGLSGTGYSFYGQIEDIRFWDSALDSDIITSLQRFVPLFTETHYFPMQECAGNTIYNHASAEEIILEEPGFEVDWNFNLTDKIKGGICQSSANVSYQSQDNLLSGFLQDLITNKEGRYVLELRRDYKPYWRGVILHDFKEFQDEPFNIISLSATDGVGLLKSVEATPDYSQIDERSSFGYFFLLALKELTSFELWSDDEQFAMFATNWFMPEINDTDEPLFMVRAGSYNSELWYESKRKLKALSWYEILEKILHSFNATLVQADGKWWVYQRDNVSETIFTASTDFFYVIKESVFSYNSTNTETKGLQKWVRPEEDRYRSDGTFSLKAVLKSLSVTYNLLSGSNILQPSLGTDNTPKIILGTAMETIPITGGVDTRVNFIIDAVEKMVDTEVYTFTDLDYHTLWCYYKIKIVIGTSEDLYYLDKINSSQWEWKEVTSSTTDSDMYQRFFAGSNLVQYDEQNNMYFRFAVAFSKLQITVETTEDIPADIVNEQIKVTVDRDTATGTNGWTGTTSDFPSGAAADDFYDPTGHMLKEEDGEYIDPAQVLYFVDGSAAGKEIIFNSENTDAQYGREEELSPVDWGSINVISKSSLQIRDGNAWTPYSLQKWSEGADSVGDRYFNQLLLDSILKMHEKPLLMYSGTLIDRNTDDPLLPIHIIGFSLKGTMYKFIGNKMTYTANRCEYSVDLIEFELGVLTYDHSEEPQDGGDMGIEMGQSNSQENDNDNTADILPLVDRETYDINTRGGAIDTQNADIDAGTGLLTAINAEMTAFKAHQTSKISLPSASTWTDVEFSTKVAAQTLTGISFYHEGESDEDKSVIVITGFNDIFLIGGVFHSKWEGAAGTDCVLGGRIMYSTDSGSTWTELKDTGVVQREEKASSAEGVYNFAGSLDVNGETWVKFQLYASDTDLTFEGDVIMDSPVSASIWINNIGNNRKVT